MSHMFVLFEGEEDTLDAVEDSFDAGVFDEALQGHDAPPLTAVTVQYEPAFHAVAVDPAVARDNPLEAACCRCKRRGLTELISRPMPTTGTRYYCVRCFLSAHACFPLPAADGGLGAASRAADPPVADAPADELRASMEELAAGLETACEEVSAGRREIPELIETLREVATIARRIGGGR